MKTELAAITDKVFFDTNILVYAYDRRDAAKQERAFDIFADGISNENGIVSAQVLGEFYNATTRRTSNPLPEEEEIVREAISLFATLANPGKASPTLPQPRHALSPTQRLAYLTWRSAR